MAKFIILCLAGLVVCDAGLITSQLVYPHFPNLKTVHHGHGATSYQNVQVQNYGSVPIPKDLQVDDGHEYQHSQYLHHDVDAAHEISSLGLEDSVHAHLALNHLAVTTEAPYDFDGHVEQVEQVELEPQDHHHAPSHYDHYDREADYEYH